MTNQLKTFPGSGVSELNVNTEIFVPQGNLNQTEEVKNVATAQRKPIEFAKAAPDLPSFEIEEVRITNRNLTQKQPIVTPSHDIIDEVDYTRVEPDTREGANVSSTFADLLEETTLMEEMKEEPDNVDSLLSRINVDLASIQIENESIDRIDTIMSMMDAKPVKQVVNCQSAYRSLQSAINNSELRSLDDSDIDMITYRKRIAKILHKHMEDTSIGKFDFPTFERITSYFDLETLLYGTYCQTFPYDNKYTIPSCPGDDCGKEYTTVVNNNTLVETRSKNDLFDRIDSIISEVKNIEDLKKYSLLNKTSRVCVPEKKIIFDIRIPSVYNYLEETFKTINRDVVRDNPAAVGALMFIDKMYVPDLVKLKSTGKLTYIPVTNRETILNTVINLSTRDSLQITKEIDRIGEKYKVTYSLKNVTCPHCGHVIDEIPLSMEQMLFLTFRQEQMGEN